jgi:hypothetical protein
VLENHSARPRRFALGLCICASRLFILDLGAVMPDDATDSGAGHRMMSRHVTSHTAHSGTFQAPFRSAHARQYGDRCGNEDTQQQFAHFDSRFKS